MRSYLVGDNFLDNAKSENAKSLRIIAASERIAEKLQNLEFIRDESEESGEYATWAYYLDRGDESVWLYVMPALENMPGDETLITGEVTLDNILECVCASQHDDEVSALCALLGEPEHFETLLDRLETISTTTNSTRIKRNVAIILAASGVSEPFNHHGSSGKTRNQIEASYAYFVGLAERARSLRERLELELGQRVVQWGERTF